MVPSVTCAVETRCGLAVDRHGELLLRRVLVVGHRRQRVGGAADHERLTVADEQIDRAVGLRDRGRSGETGDLLHERVALIEQVVGDLVVGRVAPVGQDVLVESGHLLRERVDRRDRIADLTIDVVTLRLQATAEIVEARCQRARGRQQCLARRGIGRVGGDRLHGREERVGGRRQARRRIGEIAVDLRSLGRVRAGAGAGRGAVAQRRGQVVAVDATDARHVRAGAEVAAAGELRDRRRLHDLLAREARRVDVGDVLAGRGEACLRRAQPRQPDSDQAHIAPRSTSRASAHRCGRTRSTPRYRPVATKLESSITRAPLTGTCSADRSAPARAWSRSWDRSHTPTCPSRSRT